MRRAGTRVQARLRFYACVYATTFVVLVLLVVEVLLLLVEVALLLVLARWFGGTCQSSLNSKLHTHTCSLSRLLPTAETVAETDGYKDCMRRQETEDPCTEL